MMFSPAYLSALLVEPLRFFFENFGGEDLTWSSDLKKTSIEIDTINNFNKIAVQAKPRILVSRGQYNMSPTGLNDNLAQAKDSFPNRGSTSVANMVMVQGVAQVMVEARNEGTCEKIVDLVQHFLVWSGPMIAGSQGFKNFGQAINVSPCTPTRDDTEIFQCTFNIPWSKEEHWVVSSKDNISMKSFLLNISKK